MSDERSELAAAVEQAEADIARLRIENTELADSFRAEPSDASRELLKRGAASLTAARDRLDAASAALAVFEQTGSRHGILAAAGKVVGTIAVAIAPGTSRIEREAAIDAVLGPELERAVDELGAVLTTSPEHYARELPGRDSEGRTVFEVAARVEGDRLVPAISRAAKKLRD